MTPSIGSVAGTVSALLVLGGVSAWVVRAEDSHQKARLTEQAVAELIAEKQERAAKEEAKEEIQREHCRAGNLSREWCLKQGYEVPE